MSKADALVAVGRLVLALDRGEKISEERVALYADHLADIPPDLLDAAVTRLIETLTFFPAIAEIRRTAAGLAGLLPPSPAEAIALIRQADVSENVYRRDGSLAYAERYWRWPEGLSEPIVDLLRATLSKVGEPIDANGKAHFGWDSGAAKVYELEAAEFAAVAIRDLSRAGLLPRETPQLTAGR